MSYLLVALGGAVGAQLRYLVDRWVQGRHSSAFPWGTLSVNAAGCLVLGFLTGFTLVGTGSVHLLWGTGLCGALTTYSTFCYETWRLIEQRALLLATLNVVGTIGVGLGAVSIGYLISGGRV